MKLWPGIGPYRRAFVDRENVVGSFICLPVVSGVMVWRGETLTFALVVWVVCHIFWSWGLSRKPKFKQET